MADYTDRFDFSVKPKPVAPEQPISEAGPAPEQPAVPVQEAAVAEPPKEPVAQSKPAPEPTATAMAEPASRVRTSSGTGFDTRSCRVDLPKGAIDRVRAMIPSATTKTDAIMTYIYVTMGRPPEFPEDIKALGSQYEDDGGVSDLQRQVLDLTKQLAGSQSELRLVNRQLSEMTMALLWLVGEKMGFNVDVTATADRMEFEFPELAQMRQRLVKQATDMRNREAAARGREMNAPRYKSPVQGGGQS